MASSQSFFKRVLLLGVVALLVAISVDATQIMRRPSTYKIPAKTVQTEKSPKTKIITKHILYAFADVNPTTGVISLTDPYADEQKHFPSDSWSETGNNLYGCIKQLYLLKLKQRNLKVLLSIGGWTYSQSGDDAQGQGFADLLTALRSAFTALATKKGDKVPYEITAAVAAGPTNYQHLKVPQMNAALDYWNLMAYDYAGSWLNFSDNQANLYGGARTGFNTDSAVEWYLSEGATSSKINLGMPLYGRAFEDTAGLGQSYSGVSESLFACSQLTPLKDRAGNYRGWRLLLQSPSFYSYDAAKQELVSYDTPNIVKLKAQYINSKNLAGSMFWELSTDKVGSLSLVGTSVGVLGSLDTTQNHIE
ncbi:hypothetical protein C0992_013276 [Termitomyces sp. T32_za158]|nr:hypothetical protein C0992_013276 [Termitomyces sp. T32_za158]